MSDAEQVLVVDIGSTFTKAALVDVATGQVCSRGDALTSRSTDVMDAVRELATRLGAGPEVEIVGCSSAGGGLRLAVIGYERAVTADAGFRVGLSAGAKVVHVACGPLDDAALTALAADRPDIILLVGGTDGGNADVIRHNAALLARAPLPPSVPIVVAGNSAAQADCVARLRAGGRSVITADNVLPEIGVIAPDSARAAMREAFLTHVIGGKGLSRDPAFPSLVRMATPDAVLGGVEVLSQVADSDVLVIDIGGATTDVYSSVSPASSVGPGHGTAASPASAAAPAVPRSHPLRRRVTRVESGTPDPGRADVAGMLRHARTVEADLGMRWNADSVVTAADRERLPVPPGLREYAVGLPHRPDHLPTDATEAAYDLDIARLAAVVAVRRHARPPAPGRPGRDLSTVGVVLGSGGVLRHRSPQEAVSVMAAAADDQAGGWRVPRSPRLGIDTAYLLVVVGLLADTHPDAARRVARALLETE